MNQAVPMINPLGIEPLTVAVGVSALLDPLSHSMNGKPRTGYFYSLLGYEVGLISLNVSIGSMLTKELI